VIHWLRAMAFAVWDIVKVPFPYTDRPVRQNRPALVIAAGELKAKHGLLWLAMITSAANRGWPGDVPISDLQAAGLPVPSIVRTAKVATIEARDAQPLGTLPPADRNPVSRSLQAWLAAALARD
jgi:mRNA-degrading endonuclease toxin of MazEF toxin-antitoxin module